MSKACSGAARELKAARELIIGYEEHIRAAEERIKLAYKEIESLKSLSNLEEAKAKELESVIAAEKEQVKLLLKQKDLQEKRIKQLEGQLKRSRKFTLVLGVAAGVAILIGAAK